MLHNFLTRERKAILKVATANAGLLEHGRGTSPTMDKGWGLFYDELTDLMRDDEPFSFHNELGQHTDGAVKHGQEYFRMGYSLSEVVHSYGILCQAITSHASTLNFTITPREFQQLNLSLDTAIAEAVTEYDKGSREQFGNVEAQRLAFLALELRKCIQNITVMLEILLNGSVGAQSSTSGVLEKNLHRMTKLIDGALTEVRLKAEPTVLLQRTRVTDLLHEVGVTASYEARAKQITMEMRGSPEHVVDIDRHMFISAIANLVHNAIKFSRQGGTIYVSVLEMNDHVHINIEDECGGIKGGAIDEIFEPKRRQSETGSTPGLSLSSIRKTIEKNGGSLSVKNLPGKGCIFTIELPKATSM